MKHIFLKSAALALALISACSCNEKLFLEETPYSILSPDNAYTTTSDFNLALNGLYANFRKLIYTHNSTYYPMFNATDCVKEARDTGGRLGNIASWYVPTGNPSKTYWNSLYENIIRSNVILEKLEASSLTDAEKKPISAEAKFFRGLSYRFLVYLFGGVPNITETSPAPRRDYVRDTKANILALMKEDFKAASEGLPSIDKVADGKVSDLVAKTYYAETLMSLGDNATAITLLTEVIDSPHTALMTARFGSHKNDVPGDPYNDLFRMGNQNRKSASNTEGLWVIQMECDVIGGFMTSGKYDPCAINRYACPVPYSLTDPNGKQGYACTTGRDDLNCGGRGSSFMSNTNWWLNELWVDAADVRNASYNIIRHTYYDKPDSPYYGMDPTDPASLSTNYKSQPWRWYPYPAKVNPGDLPEALYDKSSKYEGCLLSTAGGTYTDQYFLRLPEVYFLRAEAYLNSSKKDEAAADLNEVRSRSLATPVAAADVTLDYILDERARELVYEEMRRITLGRLGKYLERTRKYNTYEGPQLKDHMELWPIPYSAIEANTDAVLEQNPGYTN